MAEEPLNAAVPLPKDATLTGGFGSVTAVPPLSLTQVSAVPFEDAALDTGEHGRAGNAAELVNHTSDHGAPDRPKSLFLAAAVSLPGPRLLVRHSDGELRHKVACEIAGHFASLRRAVFVRNSVRVWTGTRNQWKDGQNKRLPRCRRCCKRWCCYCCSRSSHLLYIYIFSVGVFTSVLGLIPHPGAVVAVWALWALPGLWTPVALVKACTGCNEMVTLEWRVQTLFWFGLWFAPIALLFFPVTCFVHSEFVSPPSQTLRQLGLIVGLVSLWLLGWGLAWVQATARRFQRSPRLGVDRYMLHPEHESVGGAHESAALTGIWRARPWRRRLPKGKGKMQQASIVLEGLFWCSVAYHPSLPWASLPAPLAELNIALPTSVVARVRPEMLFLSLGLADAEALGKLSGLISGDSANGGAASGDGASDNQTEVVGNSSDSEGRELAFMGLYGLTMLTAGLCIPWAKACCTWRQTRAVRRLQTLENERNAAAAPRLQKTRGDDKASGVDSAIAVEDLHPPTPPVSLRGHGVELTMVTLLCEMMALPILRTLMAPFFCSSAESGYAANDNSSQSSMNNSSHARAAMWLVVSPTVECWTVTHMGIYLLPALFVLIGYSFFAITAVPLYLRRQTVFDINPTFVVVSFQCKFSVAAASHALATKPTWLLVLTEFVLLILFVKTSRRLRRLPGRCCGGGGRLCSQGGQTRTLQAVAAAKQVVSIEHGRALEQEAGSPAFSRIVELHTLQQTVLVWAALNCCVALYIQLNGATQATDVGGDEHQERRDREQEVANGGIVYGLLLVANAIPWLLTLSRLGCCFLRIRLRSLGNVGPATLVESNHHPEQVDWAFVEARFSTYRAGLERLRMEQVHQKDAKDAEDARAEAEKAAEVQAAMNRAAELFSGKRVLRECFLIWKFESKSYDDAAWRALVKIGTIDFKTFKEFMPKNPDDSRERGRMLESRKAYMAELTQNQAAAPNKTTGGPNSDSADGAAKRREYFSTPWSKTLHSETVVVESATIVRQTGKATSAWSTSTLPQTGQHYWEVKFTEYELRLPRTGEEGFVEAEGDAKDGGEVDQEESLTKKDVKEFKKSIKHKGSKNEKSIAATATKRNFEVAKGDFTVRDAYFVGVVNHTRTDDNGIAMNKGAWGIIPSSDLSRALRENGLDKALRFGKGCKRNPLGNIFGSGERLGCLADMNARPRTLQFYRDGQKLAGACVEGFGANVRLCACPYNEGVRATLCFSPPPEELEGVRRELISAMSAMSPEGRLAEAIEAANLAGVPDVDDHMIAAKAQQGKIDEAATERAERERQLELVAATLGDSGVSKKADADNDDKNDDEHGQVGEEVLGNMLGEDEDAEEEGTVFELRLNEHPLSLSLSGGRQIELSTLELVLCQPAHVIKCCTSRSIRKVERGCGCCCGECCWHCQRVGYVSTPRVRIVGVELNSHGGQLFLALMRKLAADATRKRCCACLQLGLFRCLSCGCIQKRLALGCEIVEVRFNIGGASDRVGRRQWWKDDDPKRFPWSAAEQDAIAAVKAAVESTGQAAPVLFTRSVAGGTVSLEEVKTLTETDVRAMVRTFPGSGVTELRLRRAGLDGAGMRALARATAVSGCLLSDLCLAHNQIGDGGAVALAAVLGLGRLTKLDLTDNRIGDEGAFALATALRPTRRVVDEADSSGSGDGDVDRGSLHGGIELQVRSCTLRELYLYDNPAISPEGAAALSAVCGSGGPLFASDDLQIALAYASTPRHVDGKVVPGETSLLGQYLSKDEGVGNDKGRAVLCTSGSGHNALLRLQGLLDS